MLRQKINMTVLPQKYGKWSMVIFQIMVEPFLLSQIPNSFQTQLLLYFLLQPKGQSKSAPGTFFVKDSIKTRRYEVYFVIEFYD